MKQEELNTFAETVRMTHNSGGNPLNKLVYRDGAFVYVPADEQIQEGEVVTVLTEKGFAAEFPFTICS